jgi:hypothetical protein
MNYSQKDERKELNNYIAEKVNEICPDDFKTCTKKGCNFLQRCNKEELIAPPSGFRKLKRLRSYKKRVEKEYYVFKGEVNPRNNDLALKQQIADFLGDIYEHKLVKGYPERIKAIQKATSLKKIIKILDKAYLETHGKMFKSYYAKYPRQRNINWKK